MNIEHRQLDAIILAAGKGTRMNGDLPKVLHPVAGRPMVQWVVDACRKTGASRCIVVVGYLAEKVKQALADQSDVIFVEQTEQLGTGHAVMVAKPCFADADQTDVLVVAGDMPLFTGEALTELVQAHREIDASGTLGTSTFEDPPHYGRIVRDAGGHFIRIVEHKDATEAQRQIKEVNISCYCFDCVALFDALANVNTDNAQNEYYLTDVLGLLRESGQTVAAFDTVPSEQAMGVNNPEQLAQVDAMLRERLASKTSVSS